jgi:hypothetical protein
MVRDMVNQPFLLVVRRVIPFSVSAYGRRHFNMKKRRQREPAEVRREREAREARAKRGAQDRALFRHLHRRMDKFEAEHRDEIEKARKDEGQS